MGNSGKSAKSAPAKAAAQPKKAAAKSVATKTPPVKAAAKPAAKPLAAKPAAVKAATPAPAKGGKAASAQPAVAVETKGKKGAKVIAVQGKKGLANGRLSSSEPSCREVACESSATTMNYCRLHYIKNWKKIKRKELILRERKLNQYIEELVAKYPDKYIEAIRQDLANDKEFSKVVHDLELDENIDDFEGDPADSAEAIVDTIKRDFDDEGDAF